LIFPRALLTIIPRFPLAVVRCGLMLPAKSRSVSSCIWPRSLPLRRFRNLAHPSWCPPATTVHGLARPTQTGKVGMAKKPRRPSSSAPAAEKKSGVTLERAVRLYRLLHILRKNPQTRKALLHRLRVDMRAFYRDLDALREAGIEVVLDGRHYRLTTP